MDVQINSNGPINLLALGVSQKASHQVQTIRQALWQASGHISFLSLPPMIPLMWSERYFTPFEQVTLPRLSKNTTFSHFIEVENNLFLGTEDRVWLATIEELLAHYSAIQPVIIPFPAYQGIYVGVNQDSMGEKVAPVTTDDWRLLYFSVTWETDEKQLVSLRYTVTSDHHLLSL